MSYSIKTIILLSLLTTLVSASPYKGFLQDSMEGRAPFTQSSGTQYPQDSEPGHGAVTSLPGYGDVKEVQYAGYVPIDNSSENYMYYWFFEAQKSPDNAPLTIWLQGGPGGSSLGGLFLELGPYKIDPKTLKLTDNKYSWNTFSNLLFWDQPVGTGFSYTKNNKYCKDEDCVAGDLYTALQAFFERYPKYRTNPLYIFGESYAGKYIPATASFIVSKNDEGLDSHINLVGVGIGDGWTHPGIQTIGSVDFAMNTGLIGPIKYPSLLEKAKECDAKVKSGDYHAAEALGQGVLNDILSSSGSPNMYDIRTFEGYDMGFIGQYLDQHDVRKALFANANWGEHAGDVASALDNDIYAPILDKMPVLLDNIKVLIYNGQFDLICNLRGVEDMYYSLKWDGAEDFKAANRTVWKMNDDRVIGYARSARKLTQVIMVDGGHLYPMNQPEFALEMLYRFELE